MSFAQNPISLLHLLYSASVRRERRWRHHGRRSKGRSCESTPLSGRFIAPMVSCFFQRKLLIPPTVDRFLRRQPHCRTHPCPRENHHASGRIDSRHLGTLEPAPRLTSLALHPTRNAADRIAESRSALAVRIPCRPYHTRHQKKRKEPHRYLLIYAKRHNDISTVKK